MFSCKRLILGAYKIILQEVSEIFEIRKVSDNSLCRMKVGFPTEVDDASSKQYTDNLVTSEALIAKIETATGEDKLDFDSIKEGSINKILTSAERTLISTALQSGDITGINKIIEVPFTTSTVESINTIPANACITKRILNLTGYNAETKINIGHDTENDLLIDETDIENYTETQEYEPLGKVDWGVSSKKLRVSISGATSGSGIITVVFGVPLN